MSNDNLPDNCKGNDPSYPWNEPEEIFCQKCGATTSMQGEALHCDNEDCDWFETPDEYDGDY